ncbi:MAG TPA: chemotaxis response regulator protein-glutamate methylesterase [Pirellulaceae bacterium]|nr:chemotaxis response regulator protein-glutamate methylesterase [Pirellulaceae bacterium]HMO91618.1 chemotaxis response regulator protein-glutamate methylesterase [Pirellulaceae bacterium]HMP68315.1 chemotaxis response regulator protein-glutamate methylesterase [Pirellulaceae bacterium]
MRKIRVLIVDDSAVIRKLLGETLAADPAVEVVGTAPNGKIAIAKIPQLEPDVITLDMEMPVMDGLETLTELKKLDLKLPIIMFSTLTSRGAQATFDALARGASDYVAKPANVGSVNESIQSVRESLLPKIKCLCPWYESEQTTPSLTSPVPSAEVSKPATSEPSLIRPMARLTRKIDIVAIGSSTGGPNALQTVLAGLPADFPVPIVITQHMPPIFTQQLANRLDQLSNIHVLEAEEGMPVIPGQAIIARGNYHLTLERKKNEVFVKFNSDPHEHSCRPAVDVMLRSIAGLYGANTLGVILTGMGHDGKQGCDQLHSMGAQIIAQDKSTSTVWGMPRAVAESGIADAVLPLDRIQTEIINRVARHRTFRPLVGTGIAR